MIIFHLARSCSASYFTALRAASTLVDTERLIIYYKGARGMAASFSPSIYPGRNLRKLET
ncbi:MAG: hypothetical protein OJF50_002236 [Nitrospira sp.]|nr:hypothetical protein [Nitrospira sp.]